MRRKLPRMSVVVVAALLAFASIACSSGGGGHKTVVLYGFSILDDVMTERIVPAFRERWHRENGEDVRVITSFGGSAAIADQIALGAPAHVALVATELDALRIAGAGLVSTDWTEYKNGGTFAYRVTAARPRQRDPKGLSPFEDLAQSGAEVVHSDPTTSGEDQSAVLALCDSTMKADELAARAHDHLNVRELLRRGSLNAGSLSESVRPALTQYALGYADALLTYENEGLLNISKRRDYRLVVPTSVVYIQPKVLIVDKNVAPGDREVVAAFVDFLWSPVAQGAFVESNFRVSDERIMAEYSQSCRSAELPFTLDYLSGWEAAAARGGGDSLRRVQREID